MFLFDSFAYGFLRDFEHGSPNSLPLILFPSDYPEVAAGAGERLSFAPICHLEFEACDRDIRYHVYLKIVSFEAYDCGVFAEVREAGDHRLPAGATPCEPGKSEDDVFVHERLEIARPAVEPGVIDAIEKGSDLILIFQCVATSFPADSARRAGCRGNSI
jgi:hypothetical protein